MKKGVFILSLCISLFLLSMVTAQNSPSSIKVVFVVNSCSSPEGLLIPGHCSESRRYYCAQSGSLMDTLNTAGACSMDNAGVCCPSGFECRNNLCREKSSNSLRILLVVLLLAIILSVMYRARSKKIPKTKHTKKTSRKKRKKK